MVDNSPEAFETSEMWQAYVFGLTSKLRAFDVVYSFSKQSMVRFTSSILGIGH